MQVLSLRLNKHVALIDQCTQVPPKHQRQSGQDQGHARELSGAEGHVARTEEQVPYAGAEGRLPRVPYAGAEGGVPGVPYAGAGGHVTGPWGMCRSYGAEEHRGRGSFWGWGRFVL